MIFNYTLAAFKSSLMNNNAFDDVFCNSQKKFHTFLKCSGPNNRGYRPFFQLNNSLLIYKDLKVTPRRYLYDFVNRFDIVALEECSIDPFVWAGISRKGVKTLL